MIRSVLWASPLLMLLLLDPTASLSSIASKSSRSRRRVKPKAPQRRPTAAKPWRYSKPKDSKWDVRHTKSFRFELKAPTIANDDSDAVRGASVDRIPMHKKPRESLSHVLGKGLLWALFKDEYGSGPTQTILVETPIPEEDRYVPDVVAYRHQPEETQQPQSASRRVQNAQRILQSLPRNSQPSFWGESGRMSVEKAVDLAEKYPHTHFVHLRWGSSSSYHQQNTCSHAGFFQEIETAILPCLHKRTAPFEFAFLNKEPRCFIDEDGLVTITRNHLEWRTAGFSIDPNY